MVLGDILRVLPHVVLGIVQGTRLRKQMAEEEEQRQFERAQRAFELWRMQVAQEAYQRAQQQQEAFIQWARSLLENLEPEEETEWAAPAVPTQPLPITLPALPSPTQTLMQPSRRRELLPAPTLQLPVAAATTPTAPTPTAVVPPVPTVDGTKIVQSGLRDLNKALFVAPSTGMIEQNVPTIAPQLKARITQLAHAGIHKVIRGIATEWVRRGLVKDVGEAQERADFWHEVLTVLTTQLPPSPILEPYINQFTKQRDYWRTVEDKQRELRLKGVEALRRFGEIFGKFGQQAAQRADRIRGWAINLLTPISQILRERARVPLTTLRDQLTTIRTILSQAPNVWMNLLDRKEVEDAYRLVDAALGEIEKRGEIQQQTLDQLLITLERIHGDLLAKANALEARAERASQAEMSILTEAIRQEFKELGLPAPDTNVFDRLMNYIINGRDEIPEPPEGRGVEEQDVREMPMTSTPPTPRQPIVPATESQPTPTPLPSPTRPRQEEQPVPATLPTTPGQTQPTRALPAPTRATQPTPTAPEPMTFRQALTQLATRVILGAAERRELLNARERIRQLIDRYRLEILKAEARLRPRLLEERLRQLVLDTQATSVRLTQANTRLAWNIASRIFSSFVPIVRQLQTKDGKPLPPDKVMHYMKRLWNAALGWVAGEQQRANKELQNIAQEWRKAGYQLPQQRDILEVFRDIIETMMQTLNVSGEVSSPPQTRTEQPSTRTQTEQSSPTFDIDELEIGGLPY